MKTCCFLLLAALAAGAQLRPLQTIPLPGVEGRIDHLAADTAGNRLFVAALGNNTVEVLDLSAGKRIRTLKGFSEPQGLAWVPDPGRLFVANGGDGKVSMFEGPALAAAGEVKFAGDADNLRYDPAAKRVWVGYGEGALAEMDAATGTRLGEVPLGAHPESFQLDPEGRRIFVNVPGGGRVDVIDRLRHTVIVHWRVPAAAANFPMAVDTPGKRLLVGCRKPAEVLVMDTENGLVKARFPCPGDTDDLFFDASRKRLYVTGGDGTLAVFEQEGPDQYRALGSWKTAPGARTGLFVPATGRLYVAVPHRGAQAAEIRVYQTE